MLKAKIVHFSEVCNYISHTRDCLCQLCSVVVLYLLDYIVKRILGILQFSIDSMQFVVYMNVLSC